MCSAAGESAAFSRVKLQQRFIQAARHDFADPENCHEVFEISWYSHYPVILTSNYTSAHSNPIVPRAKLDKDKIESLLEFIDARMQTTGDIRKEMAETATGRIH